MLDTNTVKTSFPNWTKYCDSDEAKLTAQINRATNQIKEYVPDLTADNISKYPALQEHFLNLVRKKCFDLKKDSSVFEHDPTIVTDYRDTLKRLEMYRTGEIDETKEADPTASISASDDAPNFRDNWLV